jgi:phosphoribosylaminoimidazolecarboxamide formyltransferase/IMP cyclohydrolase
MRALLSVSDKTGLVDLARGLAARGCELVSTGGTAKTLAAAGVPVVAVSHVTGFPEMLDGRVKTLHPKVHAGILARRALAEDLQALAAHGITPIDIVVVNLYPFEETAKEADVTLDELIEQIDIGGPSMVRSAAKNFRDVLVVVDPSCYPEVLDELDRPDGPSLEFRFMLAQQAFQHTAMYDQNISTRLFSLEVNDGTFRPKPGRNADLPEACRFDLWKLRDLRYGENPHQKASLFEGYHQDFAPWQIHQGKELSYTNLLDLDAAARIALEFREPVGVVIKHTNPCGVATGSTPADAYARAREADPLSAFGGVVGMNRELDEAVAAALTSTFIEAVIAPSLSDASRAVFAKRPNLRVVTADFDRLRAGTGPGHPGEEVRTFLGGVLMQEQDRVTEAHGPWPNGGFPNVVTKRPPTNDEWNALRFAWRVCAHVKSNAVVFTGVDRTLAIGAGQMSRVDAVTVAVMKAAAALNGSVAASDAFFPFRDGLDAIAAAGATAVVQPGGSVKDAEVIAAADEHGLAMVFTGIRHFRH